MHPCAGFTVDAAPTLTTSNKYLFVASLDLDKPASERAFWRFLLPSERPALQGFDPLVLEAQEDALRVKAAGNAYPVPVVASLLQPLLAEFSQTPGGLPEGGSLDIETGREAADRVKHALVCFAEQAAAVPRRGSGSAEARPALPAASGSAEARPAPPSAQLPHRPLTEPFRFMIGASDSD